VIKIKTAKIIESLDKIIYDEEEPLIEIEYKKKEEKYYSILIIGNMKIRNTKKFNWFHRLMFKLAFGIKIERIDKDV